MNKLILFLIFICCLPETSGQEKGLWVNGLPHRQDFFPIAVWLQDPLDAAAYKKGGINLYIGLWQGPTEDQLEVLRTAGMPVMCCQNNVGLDHINDPIIVGWTHGDEPDNAQADGSGGYDPCIDPSIIKSDYEAIRKRDPTRPVYHNLGQGVSHYDWAGRGTCRGDTGSYPGYIAGCDIISFDIYPVMFPAVSEINSMIHQLAPVLNSPDINGMVSVKSSNGEVPVDILVKRYEYSLYIFAVSMREGTTTSTFTLKGMGNAEVKVLGEDREIFLTGGAYKDRFHDYEVHLYEIIPK